MKLYFSPGACSLSPHIVAREAGVPVTLVKVDLGAHKTEDGTDFYQVNPKGYVPVLALDEGGVLTEGPAIVQYLGDRNPGSGLVPAAGTLARYRLQEWLGFINSELHKPFGALWNPAAADVTKQASKEALAKRFAYLDGVLAGRPWLMGETFTAADAYAFTIVNWAQFHDLKLDPYPNLAAFMGRVAARPKVQEALKAEGLIK